MPWQAGALPFTRCFAAGAEDFPAFAEGFGALLCLHHHAIQLKRMNRCILCALICDGQAPLRQRL